MENFCTYFLKGKCKFGQDCKFHHAQIGQQQSRQLHLGGLLATAGSHSQSGGQYQSNHYQQQQQQQQRGHKRPYFVSQGSGRTQPRRAPLTEPHFNERSWQDSPQVKGCMR
jgi:hypothetical protein